MLFKVLQLHCAQTDWYDRIYRLLPSKSADMSLANQNERIDGGEMVYQSCKMAAFYGTCQSYLLVTIWWEINYAIDIIGGITEEAKCDLVGLVQKMVCIQVHHP